MKALNFIRGVVRKIAAAFRRVIRPLASGAAAVVLGFALTMEAAPKAAAVVLAGATVAVINFVITPEAEAGSWAGRLQRNWRSRNRVPRQNYNLPKRNSHDSMGGFKRGAKRAIDRKAGEVRDCLDKDEDDYFDPQCARLREVLCGEYEFQCLESPYAGDFRDLRRQQLQILPDGGILRRNPEFPAGTRPE